MLALLLGRCRTTVPLASYEPHEVTLVPAEVRLLELAAFIVVTSLVEAVNVELCPGFTEGRRGDENF